MDTILIEDPIWRVNIEAAECEYKQDEFFLNASLKTVGYSVVGYAFYLGMLL
jgi:hypothetical protein